MYCNDFLIGGVNTWSVGNPSFEEDTSECNFYIFIFYFGSLRTIMVRILLDLFPTKSVRVCPYMNIFFTQSRS